MTFNRTTTCSGIFCLQACDHRHHIQGDGHKDFAFIPFLDIAQFIGAGRGRNLEGGNIALAILGIAICDSGIGFAADFGNCNIVTAAADLLVRAFPDNLEGFTGFDRIGASILAGGAAVRATPA